MSEEILNKASELFLKLGYKSVTMDDIASAMTISKKTLYKYFSNKELLISECVKQINESCLSILEENTKKGFSPIQESIENKKAFQNMFNNLGASPMFQLKKYYPKIFNEMMERDLVRFSDSLKKNIEKGMEQEFYRNNVNINHCVDFYMSIMFGIHDKDISHSEVVILETEALEYHTRAIATAKGIKELEKQLNKQL